MTEAEAAMFRDSPFFRAAVQLRVWDGRPRCPAFPRRMSITSWRTWKSRQAWGFGPLNRSTGARPSAVESRLRVIVVGIGIVGLAHAWSAAKRGHQVTVLEKDTTIPSAQRRTELRHDLANRSVAGESHQMALRGRSSVADARQRSRRIGTSMQSIHLAHHADEWAVLQEFNAIAAKLGYTSELLSRDEVLYAHAGRQSAQPPRRLIQWG